MKVPVQIDTKSRTRFLKDKEIYKKISLSGGIPLIPPPIMLKMLNWSRSPMSSMNCAACGASRGSLSVNIPKSGRPEKLASLPSVLGVQSAPWIIVIVGPVALTKRSLFSRRLYLETQILHSITFIPQRLLNLLPLNLFYY